MSSPASSGCHDPAPPRQGPRAGRHYDGCLGHGPRGPGGRPGVQAVMEMTREADVVKSLVEMADTLVDDYDIVDMLTGVADRCVGLLGASAAGVMLASPAGS